MYIDAVDDCAQLSFQLSDASTVTRKWAIKILQYNCEYENLAPKGCLQVKVCNKALTLFYHCKNIYCNDKIPVPGPSACGAIIC